MNIFPIALRKIEGFNSVRSYAEIHRSEGRVEKAAEPSKCTFIQLSVLPRAKTRWQLRSPRYIRRKIDVQLALSVRHICSWANRISDCIFRTNLEVFRDFRSSAFVTVNLKLNKAVVLAELHRLYDNNEDRGRFIADLSGMTAC